MRENTNIDDIILEHTRMLENHEIRIQNIEKILDSKRWAKLQFIVSVFSGGVVALITLILGRVVIP
ncbi:MAG TPA: hypothetical protein VIL29_08770 [Pseudothermotoga sp.]